MNDESLRILTMVEEGKISAAEAAELLKAMGNDTAGEEDQSRKPVRTGLLRGRKLRIVVTDIDTGKDKVNIRIPLRLAKLAEKMIPKEAKAQMRDQGIDLESVLTDIDELDVGPLVDIDADDEKEHVRIAIYIE